MDFTNLMKTLHAFPLVPKCTDTLSNTFPVKKNPYFLFLSHYSKYKYYTYSSLFSSMRSMKYFLGNPKNGANVIQYTHILETNFFSTDTLFRNCSVLKCTYIRENPELHFGRGNSKIKKNYCPFFSCFAHAPENLVRIHFFQVLNQNF